MQIFLCHCENTWIIGECSHGHQYELLAPAIVVYLPVTMQAIGGNQIQIVTSLSPLGVDKVTVKDPSMFSLCDEKSLIGSQYLKLREAQKRVVQ
jgi:hypothetical protein